MHYIISLKSKLRALTRALRNIGALLVTSVLTSCSPFIALNGLGSDSGYRTVTSIDYGNVERQQLDVYQPALSNNGIVVVFFYGGGWRTGQRDEYRFVGARRSRT